MNTIAEQWEDFARTVLSDDVSAVQRQEMRRAFYAGALSSLYLLHNLAVVAVPLAQSRGHE